MNKAQLKQKLKSLEDRMRLLQSGHEIHRKHLLQMERLLGEVYRRLGEIVIHRRARK